MNEQSKPLETNTATIMAEFAIRIVVRRFTSPPTTG